MGFGRARAKIAGSARHPTLLRHWKAKERPAGKTSCWPRRRNPASLREDSDVPPETLRVSGRKRDCRMGRGGIKPPLPHHQSPNHPAHDRGLCPEKLPLSLHFVPLLVRATGSRVKRMSRIVLDGKDARGTPPYISPDKTDHLYFAQTVRRPRGPTVPYRSRRFFPTPESTVRRADFPAKTRSFSLVVP